MDLETGKITVSPNTVSIHHYSGSWLDKKGKRRGDIYKIIMKMFGKKIADCVRYLFMRR